MSRGPTTPRAPVGRGRGEAGEPMSVEQLVAKFRLRRRADGGTYRRGVALANADVVRLEQVAPTEVVADVRDAGGFRVVLAVRGGEIESRCSCGASGGDVCVHSVAAEHALWLRARPRGADDERRDAAGA